MKDLHQKTKNGTVQIVSIYQISKADKTIFAIVTNYFNSLSNVKKPINKAASCCVTILILLVFLMISMGGCSTLQTQEIRDEISNLSFSHDGRKVIFDRCRSNEGCHIQVYDLETGELSAYESPANERWTMARQSYDGKKIVFSVIPIKDHHLEFAIMQIAVMDSDGRNKKEMTSGLGAKIYPVFSHSGKKVLYSRSAYMRKKGKTPAAQYDAWEVDLETGTQKQLTFFKYFYMGNLTYFPDDERFIYYGELPEAFPGLDLPKDSFRKAQEMIRQEQMRRRVGIGGVLTMKKGEILPKRHYYFGKEFYAQRPLLSKDGTWLIFEKGTSAGKFYLYSSDGNHRLVGEGGSLNSAAISPDGELLAIIAVGKTIDTYNVRDGKREKILYLPCAPKIIRNWKDAYLREKSLYTMIPETPSIIIKH
ncbi:MAG: hypothetical protein RBR63_11590 [Methanosarcina vacuolata]|jgi:tricorn protease-like protein|nr:hypothetical protein [Methanosarcina vacuolata]